MVGKMEFWSEYSNFSYVNLASFNDLCGKYLVAAWSRGAVQRGLQWRVGVIELLDCTDT
jgi:hypothetical protein